MATRIGLILVLCWSSEPIMADNTWVDVHPYRLQTLIGGRDFTYDKESFVSRFTYRSLSEYPRVSEDGLHGTGGSVTNDELFLDIGLQKTMIAPEGRWGVVARMQRREDFDGRFDRQLIGLLRRLGENWDVIFLSELKGDKSLIDLQYEANWRPGPDRFFRFALVQTDELYNAKTADTENKYRRTPDTWFAHYRHPLNESTGPRGYLEMAVNYSSRASYEDREQGRLIEGTQLRMMAAARVPLFADWQAGIRLETEDMDRDLTALSASTPAPPDFDRRMVRLKTWIEAPQRRREPAFGMEYFRLEEDGWFGDNLAASGDNQRREVTVYLAGKYRTGEASYLNPMLSIARVDYRRDLIERPEDFRDDDEWMVSLGMPWRFEMDKARGALVTVNPTFRLRPFTFGGGNIQVHWPF